MRRYVSLALAVVFGSALGALVSSAIQARPAEAQRAAFQQCFFGVQEPVDINNDGMIRRPGASRMIAIPDGWTVVGGGGVASRGAILLCR